MDREIAEQLFDPGKKKHGLSRPPRRWFYAMLQGIKKRSDVSDPAAVVGGIWRRLSAKKRAEIKRREAKGERFVYDLPLPQDCATKGTGTVRMVKPFNLAEVQVNVSRACYAALQKSRLFQRMKRQDGSTALVKRCKSRRGNSNIFVDVI